MLFRSLQRNCGCQINIHDLAPFQEKPVVEIVGYKTAVRYTLSIILKHAADLFDDGKCRVFLILANNQCGALIGQKGRTAQEINRNTGVIISKHENERDPSDKRGVVLEVDPFFCVEVRGPPEAVNSAFAHIVPIIADFWPAFSPDACDRAYGLFSTIDKGRTIRIFQR